MLIWNTLSLLVEGVHLDHLSTLGFLASIGGQSNFTFSTRTVGVDTISSGTAKVLPCVAAESARKVGTILPLSYQPLCVTCEFFPSVTVSWENIYSLLQGNCVVVCG